MSAPKVEPPATPLSLRSCVAAGFAFACAMTLAFPPVGFWPASFLCVIPLAWLARRSSRQPPREHRPIRATLLMRTKRLLAVVIGMAPFWAWQMWWTASVTDAAYPFLVLYLCLVPSAYPLIAGRLLRESGPTLFWIGATSLWLCFEMLRGRVFFDGFAWFYVGHPLIDAGPWLSWPAWIGGAELVSLLTAGIGIGALVTISDWWSKTNQRTATRVAVAAGIVAVAWSASGWLIIQPATIETDTPACAFQIGLAQTNVPQDVKNGWSAEQRERDFAALIDMTFEAADSGAELVVWPETMFPGMAIDEDAVQRLSAYRSSLASYADWVRAMQDDIDIPMLIGATGFDAFRINTDGDRARWDYDAMYNSVFLIDGGGVVGRYDKLRLTPFGETMPYISWSDNLESWLLGIAARGMSFALEPGESVVIFDLRPTGVATRAEPVRVCTPICFEVTDAATMRRLVAAPPPGARPEIIVNLTNDGWFGNWKAGKAQHLMAARWRCAEVGVPMVRAANTGLSASIDRWGRLLASGTDESPGAHNVAGVLSASVIPNEAGSLFLSGGWRLPWVIAGAGFVAPVIVRLARRRSRGDTDETSTSPDTNL